MIHSNSQPVSPDLTRQRFGPIASTSSAKSQSTFDTFLDSLLPAKPLPPPRQASPTSPSASIQSRSDDSDRPEQKEQASDQRSAEPSNRPSQNRPEKRRSEIRSETEPVPHGSSESDQLQTSREDRGADTGANAFEGDFDPGNSPGRTDGLNGRKVIDRFPWLAQANRSPSADAESKNEAVVPVDGESTIQTTVELGEDASPVVQVWVDSGGVVPIDDALPTGELPSEESFADPGQGSPVVEALERGNIVDPHELKNFDPGGGYVTPDGQVRFGQPPVQAVKEESAGVETSGGASLPTVQKVTTSENRPADESLTLPTDESLTSPAEESPSSLLEGSRTRPSEEARTLPAEETPRLPPEELTAKQPAASEKNSATQIGSEAAIGEQDRPARSQKTYNQEFRERIQAPSNNPASSTQELREPIKQTLNPAALDSLDPVPPTIEPAATNEQVESVLAARSGPVANATPAQSQGATPTAATVASVSTTVESSSRTTSSAPSADYQRLNEPQQRKLIQRVTRAFRLAANRDGEIRLRLSPPHLGSVRLQVRITEGSLSARLETETPAARQALLENLPVLRERLLEQGMTVETFDVDVQDRSQEQSGRQSADHSRHDPVERDTQRRSHSEQKQTGDDSVETESELSDPTTAFEDGGLNVIV